MDQTRFDDLSRRMASATTRRAGLKATLGALLAGAGVAAVSDVDAKKRRNRCKPACGAAQVCVDRQCTCPGDGTVCGTNCCLAGQECQGGRCVTMPNPGACVAFGQVCKNVGVPCCEGFVCGSGQGGAGDVACYVPAGSACATTSDCVFGSQCLSEQCVANPQPTPTPEPTPVERCVPNVSVTGNATTDGAALRAALDAAKTAPDSVISLGTGEYFLGTFPSSGPAYDWNSANAVTVRACPGATATITADVGNGPEIFRVPQGSMTFRGPGLTVKASNQDYNYAFIVQSTGSLNLEDVTVEANTGVYLRDQSSARIDGGSITTVYGFPAAISIRNPSNVSLACSPNPTVVGPCYCNPGGATCPANGMCCTTWST